MTISEYIQKLNNRYQTGISTEHSYRSDLLGLIEALVPGITITNEPKRVACGAPDYIITRRNIPVGYIEAKDIGADLNNKIYKEQFTRYRQSLDNLIITDYLTFQFFTNGAATTSITIGEVSGNKIHPVPDNFERFLDLIKNFCEYTGQTIKSAQKLSKMMAAKAKLLANVIELALDPDKETEGVNELQNINLLSQYESFKQVLIHDITPKAFADIYAQTIAYGMFAARLNDPSLENFSRQEAAELIPKSNPFLRKLFQYIAGYDLDDRIVWIVDALADIFRATNVEEMLRDFGKSTHQTDPFIHFYETFLSEYDPKLRKSRGVWYTPEPVVNFIVRAVDDILKTEFGLSQGLADTSKIKIKVPGQEKKLMEKDVHRVQILDPAAGTGTFLAEVIKQIHKKFEGQQGIWSQYVEDHLIPRINGFEILMASYTMAHLKLELLLREMGYKPTRDQRLRVYLTNSLEEHHPDTGTLFANWLSSEANEANHVKRDTPVMVVLGNPPYSGHSSNRGKWIESLIQDYFLEPSGGRLKEQNAKWLYDDYVKFIRYAQFLIEKQGEGVLAFITNNGYLDNPTFRGMRYTLLETFNIIYSIDLHGSAKKKECDPSGGPDKNVFDIQQGVTIILAVKKRSSEKRGLQSFDLFGTREYKYQFLFSNSLDTIQFNINKPEGPYFIFKNLDNEQYKEYNNQINVMKLFNVEVMGFQTHRDDFAIALTKKEIIQRANDLRESKFSDEELEKKYKIKDNRDWKLSLARNEIKNDQKWEDKITLCTYRPFDDRYCYFSTVMMDYPRKELIQHVFERDNLVLGIGRQGVAIGDTDWCLITISKYPIDANVFRRGGIYLCPLYLYSRPSVLSSTQRIPNLNPEITKIISEKLLLPFINEKEDTRDSIAPIDIFDYVYAILHSPAYRTQYKEFLKTDFPRVPYPKDRDIFWLLVQYGSELRQIHLLENLTVNKFITSYPQNGSNEVGKLKFESGVVWINNEQHFEGVPQVAWDFSIGGYQPAQKWLKDRKGRVLSYEDIMHYQKIIVALTETDRIMKEIDKIDFLP